MLQVQRAEQRCRQAACKAMPHSHASQAAGHSRAGTEIKWRAGVAPTWRVLVRVWRQVVYPRPVCVCSRVSGILQRAKISSQFGQRMRRCMGGQQLDEAAQRYSCRSVGCTAVKLKSCCQPGRNSQSFSPMSQPWQSVSLSRPCMASRVGNACSSARLSAEDHSHMQVERHH